MRTEHKTHSRKAIQISASDGAVLAVTRIVSIHPFSTRSGHEVCWLVFVVVLRARGFADDLVRCMLLLKPLPGAPFEGGTL